MSDTFRPPVLLGDTQVAPPDGWHAAQGFHVPETPWDLSSRRLVCVGTVTDEADVIAAVTALSRGVGLVVSLAVSGPTRHRLLEDLHRLGDVSVTGHATAATGHGLDGLGPEQRGLLHALADGATVAEAAQLMHMSRRTASRRLGEVRTALGVDSTAEAVARWVECGRPGGPGSA